MAEAAAAQLEAQVRRIGKRGRRCARDAARLLQGAASAPPHLPAPSRQYAGFKACFGGEELKRACATLAGALVNNKAKVQGRGDTARAGHGPGGGGGGVSALHCANHPAWHARGTRTRAPHARRPRPGVPTARAGRGCRPPRARARVCGAAVRGGARGGAPRLRQPVQPRARAAGAAAWRWGHSAAVRERAEGAHACGASCGCAAPPGRTAGGVAGVPWQAARLGPRHPAAPPARQELSGRLPPASADQIAFLRQASRGRGA